MRERSRPKQDNDGLCDKGTCRFFTCVVLTFIVIISEIVLISQGWTWGPWFFFNILIVFTRLCPCSSSSSVSESTPSQAEMVDVTSDRAHVEPDVTSDCAHVEPMWHTNSFEGTLESEAGFRNAVERASTETTEVVSTKWVIISDKLDGRYDIQYERDGRLVDAIMNLQFKRGFCGWHIRGTRNGLDDGPFCIQQGFLAKSGKLYWEEREESEAAYSVLVVGRFVWVDGTHGSFHGDWLSSKKMETGRFTKLIRRDDEEDGKFAAMSSAIV